MAVFEDADTITYEIDLGYITYDKNTGMIISLIPKQTATEK